jgi:tetratricopeptide (TPR) repeat protein
MSPRLSPDLIKDCETICQTEDVRKILQCGLACQSDGLFQDACGCYEQVLTLKPKHFDALHMLGVLAIQTQRPHEAVELIAEAVAQNPRIAVAHRNFALALIEAGRKQEAAECYERAILLEPQYGGTYVPVAGLLVELGDARRALAWCDWGMQYHASDPFLHLARAVALRALERLEEALDSCDRAIVHQPTCAEAWDKRGAALQELGRPHESLKSYAEATRLRPGFDPAYHHAGLVHLQLGEFDPGWALLEHREQARRDFARPRWHPSTHRATAHVLLHSEQGLGDTLQFARYAPMVAKFGMKVTLMVQQPLLDVMQTLGSGVTVIADTPTPPAFDLQCPLMSLPHAFQTVAASIPAKNPYLAADPRRVTEWREHLGPSGFKIGVCWHGSGLPAAVGRAFPLAMLAAIAQFSGVRLISLQKGFGVEQLVQLPPKMRVEDLGSQFDAGETGFLDTAAVMECLDLIITCDTSIAHLAGALGRPTWIALKWVSDWRWLTDRDDSPWYPSVRLFRQTDRGNWHGVFESMQAALTQRQSLTDCAPP